MPPVGEELLNRKTPLLSSHKLAMIDVLRSEAAFEYFVLASKLVDINAIAVKAS
jgi:hypothetical protein